MPGWPARAVRVVTGVELAVAATALVMIFVLVLIQAAQRYLPVDGLLWTGELAQFSLVWLTFTAVGVLVTTDSHIALKLVDSVGNPVVVRCVRVFACLVVAATGLGMAAESLALIDSEGLVKSPALQMPMSWLYVPLLMGFVSTTVRALVAAGVVAVRGVPPAAPADGEASADELRGELLA